MRRATGESGRTPRRGLTFALLGALVAVETVTVGAIILSQQIKTHEALDIHTRQLLMDVVSETRENAQGFLDQAETSVRIAQDLYAAQQLSLERPAELERYFLAQLKVVPQMDGIFFGDDRGQFLFVKRAEPDLDHPQRLYTTKIIRVEAAARSVQRTWRGEGLVELSRADDPQDAYDPRERPWFRMARGSAGPVWTDPYVFFTSRRPGITVAARVRDAGGALVGVIGADIELSALSRFLAKQPIAAIGAAVIVHQNGDVLAYPRPELVSQPTADGQPRLARLQDLDVVTARAAQTLESQAPGLRLAGRLFSTFVVNGQVFRAVFVPFLSRGEGRWIMGVYAPENHFAGTIREGQRESMILAIAISILITALAFFLGPRLLRPLAQLQERADLDPLTSELNRRRFLEDGERLFAASGAGETPLSAIMLDLDGFKAVNDGCGHQVGDEVLTAVSGRLVRGLSSRDVFARYGGDEFAVLMPRTELAQAVHVAERLRALIRDEPIRTSAGELSITISLGVAARTGSTGSLLALIDEADQRLLRAKREGRDRVVGMPADPAT